MQITISKDEFVRLVRAKVAIELISIYVADKDYPEKKFLQKLCNQIMVHMPFSTPDESGWHE